MNINAYTSFTVLAKELNMTRAAEKLGITQQALSAQIMRLEAYYHVQLFSRSPRLKLTYAGERLAEYSKQLQIWTTHVGDELQEIHDGEKGQIRVGATAKRGFDMIPRVFPAFYREYPHVEVCVVEGTSPQLLQDLYAGRSDLCLVVSEIDNSEVCSTPITEERSLLFVSDSVLMRYCPERYEYLLSNKNCSMPIRYFQNCPFILNVPGNRVRKKCDDLFYRSGMVPNVIFSAANAMNLAEIASRGLGATILNSSTRSDAVQNLHRFQIDGLSELKVLKVSYLRSRYLSRPARRFIEIMQEVFPRDTALPQPYMELL